MLTSVVAATLQLMLRNLEVYLPLDDFVVARIDDGVARLEIRKPLSAAFERASLHVLIAMLLAYACRTVLMLSPDRSSAMPEGFSLFVLGGLGASQRHSLQESADDSPS